MLQEDPGLTKSFNFQFPKLTIKVLINDEKDGAFYKILYDAYASPGQVKKIDGYAKKLKLASYQLERIPF